MMFRTSMVMFIVLGWLVSLGAAQTGSGQLCLRAYEDRNGNATRDPGEPPITRGISVALLDVNRVILDSQLMDDSPNATTGTLCFQRLAAGQYSLRVLSADYGATTPTDFIAAVSDNGSPQVFDYGGQIILSALPAPPQTNAGDFALTPAEQQGLVNRLVLAAIGALFVMGVMTVLGAVIYVLFFRQRRDAQPPRSTTEAYQPLRPATGSVAPVAADPFSFDPTRPPAGQTPRTPSDPFAFEPSRPAEARERDPFDFEPARPATGSTPPIDLSDPFGFDTPATDAPRRSAEPDTGRADTDGPPAPQEDTTPPRSAATPTPARHSDPEPWDALDFTPTDNTPSDSGGSDSYD